LLDLDGTIYLGDRIIPGALEFLRYLQDREIQYRFFTNNSSRSSHEYLAKLTGMGLPVDSEQILTSGQAAVRYLRRIGGSPTVYLVGTPSLHDEFRQESIAISDSNPDYVVLAFDTTLTYEKLVLACRFIEKGVPYIATHPDRVCPAEDGNLPDCGALTALIETATGVKPEAVTGKPDPIMVELALEGFSGEKDEVALVGDRLYTDIQMAANAGIHSILVLTGETQPADTYSPAPDWVAPSVREILAAFSA